MSAIERITLEPAFVLHVRAYRETSALLEVFGRDAGRNSLIARGLRKASSRLRPILQPFQPLLLSWSGRPGKLMTLTAAESSATCFPLQGEALLSAFYLNELLLRLLHRGDPAPRIFVLYAETLQRLGQAGATGLAAILRIFEMRLLSETGYGLNLEYEANTGEPIDPLSEYHYAAEQGPIRLTQALDGQEPAYRGVELLAMARGELDSPAVLRSARRLLRAVLDHHLDGRPLKTRQVARALRR